MILRPSPSNQSRRECFTIIEILVVVLIMAIAAAIIIPNAIGTQDLQVISAARMLASDLQYAQNTAITFQSQVTIDFDTADESYSLSNTSGFLIHPMTKSDYAVDFAAQSGFDQLDIVSASFSGTASVSFDALGSPDNAGTVVLQAGSHVYRVDVAAATGKVTVTAVSP